MQSYLPLFNHIEFIDNVEGMETGFIVFNRIIHSYISTNENVYLSIVSLSLLLPFTFIAGKYSKIPSLSFIVFTSFVIFIFSFSALRQTIAIGLTTWSYYYVHQRKLLPFIGLVFLATMFHSTAVIFGIVYPLCNYVEFTKKTYCIAIVGTVAIMLSLSSFLDYILPYLFEENRYSHYYQDSQGTPAYNLLMMIFGFFLLTFIVKHPDKTACDMRLMVFLSFCCQSLGLISPVAPRIGFYFFIFIGIALANIIPDCGFTSINRSIMKFGMTAFMIFFFFYCYSNGYLNVIPYKFYWE